MCATVRTRASWASKERIKIDFKKLIFLLLLSFSLAVEAEEQKEKSEIRPPAALTLHAFPKNLKHNFLGFFRRENTTALTVGLAATAVSWAFDDSLRDYFRDHHAFHNEARVGSVMGSYAALGSAVGGLFIVGHFSHNDRFHSFTYALAQGYIVSNAWTNVFKFAFRRVRPDESNKRSFVSGHAANAFMVAAIVNHYYGLKAGIPAYGLAAFVGASRVEERRHFLSDVVAGATLGYVIGKTVAVHTTGTPYDPRVELIPSISPGRKEAALAAVIHF